MTQLKVLQVEDDLDIQEIARLSLETIGGFDVLQCSSGAQALEKAQAFAPDVLLLDVMMPEMSGDVVLGHLRNLDGLKETPAIFMTARAQKPEVEELKSLGAIDVILKPFDPMELPGQILAALDRA